MARQNGSARGGGGVGARSSLENQQTSGLDNNRFQALNFGERWKGRWVVRDDKGGGGG